MESSLTGVGTRMRDAPDPAVRVTARRATLPSMPCRERSPVVIRLTASQPAAELAYYRRHGKA